MPKLGMEPIRREALVQATIAEVGRAGSLDVTVGQIARRAGVSAALAHHYFGAKDELFIAAMRHILAAYGRAVRRELRGAAGSRGRLAAVIRASFAAENFGAETVAAWLSFYVRAQTEPQARRLLRVYRRRLASNLLHDLRPLAGPRAPEAAATLAAVIDGLYLHAALGGAPPDPGAASRRVLELLDMLLGGAGR